MNSYFEQSGFYGHPHQTTGMGMTSGSHHDQNPVSGYRGFPLSLGMSPYANHHLNHSRSTQDSPYDASITAACSKIYDGAYNKDCAKTTSASSETNGYKEIWNTSSSGGSGAGGGSTGGGGGGGGGATTQSTTAPVRPSACTPDSRVGGYLDTAGGSPVSRGGGAGSVTGGAWNANCSITATGGQTAAAAGLHQSANHTFYPWMAIAGL